MTDPLTLLIRKIALHYNVSRKDTCILPLSEIHTIVIYLDTSDADYISVEKMAAKFFGPEKKVILMAPNQWEINIFGWMKDSRKYMEINEDLFICLDGFKSFSSEYAARCSRARFKVGRSQLKGDIFDIVLNDPADKLPRQPQIFELFTQWFERIR